MKKILPAICILASLPSFAKPPSIMLAYPAGGQAGTTFKATVGALDADSAKDIVVSGDGVSAKIIKIDEMPEDRQKAAAKRDEAKGMKFMEVEFSIDPKAQPGLRTMRAASKDGFSNSYFFYVGNLPEIMETAKHHSMKDAQEIKSFPCTVNGQIYEGERDFYKFQLQKGKTYVFDLKARRIRPYLADAVPGWFQATMRLYDSKGNTLNYVDDFQNSPDPTMVFVPQENITCFLEIRDALFRGRDDFVYRLDMGELPLIEAIFPCGGSEDATTRVELFGVNLPTSHINVSKEPGDENIKEVFVKNKGMISNPVKFVFDQMPESIIKPSAQAPEELTQIPCVLNGVMSRPYEKFWVRFSAKAKETLTFEALSARLGYPADLRLTLYKAQTMAQIASNDDINDPSFGLVTAQLDPRIIHTFAESGDYILKLDESRNHGGHDYVFRLKISETQKGVDVSMTPASLQIGKGNYAPLRINANRFGNWKGEVEIVAKDLPKGFSIEKCVLKPNEESTYLVLKAAENADAKTFSPTLIAKANIDARQVELPVKASEELTQAFFINHTIPVDDLNITVMNKAPFRLEWGKEMPDQALSFSAGNSETLYVKLIRDPNFKGTIRIMQYRRTRGLKIQQYTMRPKEDEAKLRITASTNLTGVVEDNVYIAAYARKGEENYIYVAPPFPVKLHGRAQKQLTK